MSVQVTNKVGRRIAFIATSQKPRQLAGQDVELGAGARASSARAGRGDHPPKIPGGRVPRVPAAEVVP